jgi:hypothetical protein
MIKTKVFVELDTLKSIRAYQKFIEENQQIEIISVNIFGNDHVLITYRE